MKNRRYSERLVIVANQNIKERDYWLNKLSGDLVKSSFPYDRPEKVGEFPIDTLEFRLPDELYQQLIKLSKGSGHTLHLLMVTGLVLLLNKYSYSGNNDIIVGIPIEKQAVDKEFANTVLLLRNRLKDNMTVKQLILEIRQTIVEAVENYNYPVEVLYDQLELSDLAVKWDEDPLVGVGILLENIHDKAYLQRIAPDVTFLFSNEENRMRGRVEYRRHLYVKTTIGQVVDHLIHLMGEALFNVDTEIDNISILSPPERKQVLAEFNHCGERYPRGPTVVELFASQVNRTPDKIALVHENSWLTYNELNSRSDYLSSLLRMRGVSPGSVVGLMVKPSFSMMVGIIGILKAGGAYLPLAPDWPEARVRFLISDSSVRLLLSEVNKVSGEIEVIDLYSLIEENEAAGPTHFTHLTHPAHPTHLSYVIYTSGSTGLPKGVPITHGNLTPLLLWSRDYFGFGEHTRVLQNLSYTFDFGAFELLTTLIFGGALYFFDRDKMTSTSEYVDFIHMHEIDTLHTTPSFLNSILIPGQHMHTLRILHLGGERLTGKLIGDVSQQLSPKCRIYNGYGPTETTINSSIFGIGACVESLYDYPMKIMDNTPIGKPSANNIIFIMDTHLNLLPVGVPGELYIGGGGVASGYLNRPELTAEMFLYSRYFSKRLYKTGDLGCWLPDGDIEFLGRIDHQVKIRGLRVELGEIESRLLTYHDIKDVLVICRDDYLCAYIVPRGEVSLAKLRGYLSEDLPDYMVPSYFVYLEKMPLTASGKVNRNVLPDPKTGVTSVEYTPPVGFFEEQLARIWSELLRIESDQISVHADFFELGGHSLLATSMAARVQKHFGVKVPLGQILKTPTVRELVGYIKIASVKDKYLSIQLVEKKEYYVLSPAQKRMYILQQMDLQSTSYNLPVLELLEGDIDGVKLENMFRKLIQRHESLRTSFRMVEGGPVQKVHEADEVEFAIQYYENVESFVRPFDLSYAPLVRIGTLKLVDQGHLLMVDMHHITADGQSMRLIVEDIIALYQGNELPRLRLQYKDYAEWQNLEEQKAALEKQKEYWLKEFAGEMTVLNLPTDFPRPAVQRFQGDMIEFEVGESETSSLYNLAKHHDLTLYMVLLTIYYVLLEKLGGQQDLVIGIPVLGRRHADLENIIGMFVNTLPLRNDAAAGKRFKDFLKEVGKRALSAFENQEYPFEELVEKLSIERDTSRNPLFDTMFTLVDGTREQKNRKDYQYKDMAKTSKFDLTLVASDQGGKLSFVFEYSTNLFKQEKIERFAAYFKKIIASVLESEVQQIAEIDMLSQEDKNRLLVNFSNVEAEYLPYKSIGQLLEEQVNRTPRKVTVVTQSCLQVTYGELNERANELADIIRNSVGENNCIGIMFDNNPYLLTAIFAVIKSGNWFVPITPNNPDDRVYFVLNDCGIKLLITDKANHEKVETILAQLPSPKGLFCICLDIDIGINNIMGAPKDKYEQEVGMVQEAVEVPAIHPCYIIYTSGSTGRPKGVLITQENVVPLLIWFRDYYKLGEDMRVLQSLSYSFDFGVFEILTTVLFGGMLYQGCYQELSDLVDYIEHIDRQGINIIHTTPSFFKNVVSLGIKMLGLKILHLGGEMLTANMAVELSKLVSSDCMICNGYGPTEASVNSSIFALRAGDAGELTSGGIETILIGKPSANNIIYILDEVNNLQPVGVVGELCVSGRGVSMGYLNRPELTVEKFLHLILNTQHLTLYKTGDLARWDADGNIEFIGRMDQQVKVRGFRIELGEIENRLLEMDRVKEAVVIDREINGEKYLCAYIVLADYCDSELTTVTEELRKYLYRGLPDYMVPSYFMLLEKLPLTPTGKTDRKALPKPESFVGVEYVAPGNEIEEQLVDIWSEVLGIVHRPIGINDNFFELGGHSLNATILAAKIHKVFEIKVPLIEIFKIPSVKLLSQYINGVAKEKYHAVEIAEKKDYYMLSPAQKRMYILQQMDLESTGYNMPVIEVLEGDFDKEKLKETFRKIINRQESLRTSFHMVEEAPIQRVHDPDEVEFEIQYYENIESFVRPFDLSYAPLVRIGLLELEGQDNILMVDMHHIISDGQSMRIIVEDFIALYQGKKLPHLRLQYKDYAEWQNNAQQKNYVKKQEAYWLEQFENGIPVLDLPNDCTRVVAWDFEGKRVFFEIGVETTTAAKKVTKSQGVSATLYMVLLSAFYILLFKLSCQEDIVVGTPLAGRMYGDLENIIGMFVNTLPLKHQLCGDESFIDFLKELKKNTLKAFENQDYPFEDLVEKLPVTRDAGRHPVFDVMFVWQNIGNNKDRGQLSQLANISGTDDFHNAAKFDLTLIGWEHDDCLNFIYEYSTALFKHDTIQRFIDYFKRILLSVVNNCRQTISEVDILSKEELNQLLERFNCTREEYPVDKTIHQLFEAQVERTPHHIAVLGSENAVLTYKKLNEKSNQLAHLLVQKGVKPGTVVAIMVERTLEIIVGILGILKVGGAYLPIDMDYPAERIRYMLDDSNAKILLSKLSKVSKGIEVVNLSNVSEGFPAHPTPFFHPTYPCYIIYTSGSTGRPKGVMIEHHSVVNLAFSQQQTFKIDKKDRVLLFSSICFDASVEQVLISLFSGAVLVLIDKQTLLDIDQFERYILKQSITHIHAVPSFLNNMTPGRHYSIKRVISGGDVCPVWLAEKWCKDYEFYNEYGPTETTVTSIESLIEQVNDSPERLPIGRPLNNTMVYLLDRWMRPVPVRVMGELYIGGEGVARGYLNNLELTVERFIFSPFKTGERLYRTGDLARWHADGNIEFLGRIDQQVKIRGFRIEPGEIENLLLEMNSIKKAVVIDREINSEKYLCAYIVLADGFDREPTAAAEKLRKYLSLRLPNYMIPSYFMLLEKLSLTPTGKTDRKALPEPEAVVRTEYVAPRNEIEEQLVDIWSEVLGIVYRPIGINDNFFELGGHSLNAISVLSRIHKAFDIKVPLMEMFKYPNIWALSEYINRVINNCDQYKQKELSKLVSLEKIVFDVEFNI
jgi:tyrocidine synthetase-3